MSKIDGKVRELYIANTKYFNECMGQLRTLETKLEEVSSWVSTDETEKEIERLEYLIQDLREETHKCYVLRSKIEGFADEFFIELE